ncbi:MFS transporter [Kitasatospora sp. NBC_01287]|uniref:MFS transporter n=1 Tax=Kitasatospora sp. NBC_01287 TaxID=2903573 RepID=UPI00225BDC5E|nr:MFS transporter [Kitasatospora sp. NBC_01287]MCX4744050.1 MFS transporter [Kitasatospora sp. NBC_01287]
MSRGRPAGARRWGLRRSGSRSTGPRFTGLWRERDFLKLWAGESVSLMGAQVTQLALPLAAVYQLHASSTQLGLLNAANYAPFLGATLFIGVWVDRRRRRPLMISANLGRALLVAGVPLCAALGVLHIGYLYLASLAIGTLTVLFDISYQSYLPSLVDREHLVEGNSKLSVSSSIAQVGGPGLAGLLIGWITAPLALLVNCGTYLVSVAGLAAIRRPEPEPARPEVPLSTARSISEGLRVVFGNASIRAIALEAGTYNLCWMSLQTVFVLYAARRLDMSPGTIGLVLGIGALGSLVGAVGAGRLKERLGLGRAIMLELVLCCCAPVLVPLAPGRGVLSYALYVAAFALCGLGSTMSTIHVVSLRQVITPDHLLGRVNAGCRFVAWGPLPLGALLGGTLGDAVGLRTTLFLTAAGFVLALLWVAFSPVPRLKDFPTDLPHQLAAAEAEAVARG